MLLFCVLSLAYHFISIDAYRTGDPFLVVLVALGTCAIVFRPASAWLNVFTQSYATLGAPAAIRRRSPNDERNEETTILSTCTKIKACISLRHKDKDLFVSSQGQIRK
jgi:hypothetical protein